MGNWLHGVHARPPPARGSATTVYGHHHVRCKRSTPHWRLDSGEMSRQRRRGETFRCMLAASVLSGMRPMEIRMSLDRGLHWQDRLTRHQLADCGEDGRSEDNARYI